MNNACVAVVCTWTALWVAGPAVAQEGAGFKARLSLVPVDAVTSRTTSGTGSVTGVLIGNSLFITGTFDGLNSRAMSAHLHRGPKGQRGPVAFPLSVAKAVSGVLGGSVELTASQIDELKKGQYYVQIHTDSNPDGEIRGWLFLQEPQA